MSVLGGARLLANLALDAFDLERRAFRIVQRLIEGARALLGLQVEVVLLTRLVAREDVVRLRDAREHSLELVLRTSRDFFP